MAVGDQTLYSIIAPPESTVADVTKTAVEVYLNEETPPELIVAEPLGRDPSGNSIWGITVTEGAASPQDGSGGDGNTITDTDTLFGNGGP